MSVISGGSVMPGGNQFYTDFKVPPIFAKKGGGALAGTTGFSGLMWLAGSYAKGQNANTIIPLEYFILGAGQTIVAPVQTAVGLDIGMDQTSTEGIEIAGGVLTRGLLNAIAGDNALVIRAKVKVEDASGAGLLQAGVRRAEAFQADWNDYLDLVSIGIKGTANPNTIMIEKILNNAATAEVDTTMTWADNAEKSLTVILQGGDRKVLFQVNDAAPTVTTTFTADDDDPFIPFIRFEHAADLAGKVELTELSISVE